ncbi:MAG TPA: RcpC/CpaB family pilus assembly protein [Anaerolineae bacterium]|nr:RcpC/CpaB family pilus assembly protein [Anaerolineae bacterium]
MARRDVPVRTLITEEDVVIRQLAPIAPPIGAANTLDQVLDKISKSNLVMGEVLLVDRLADPDIKGVNMLYTMPEEQVLIAIPGSDLMSRTGLLSPGDRVDILFSLEFVQGSGAGTSGGSLATLSALQGQEIQAIVMARLGSGTEENTGGIMGEAGANEGGINAVLLAVDPQDALVLKYLRDAGGSMDFALRAPTSEQLMRTDSVTQDYLTDRYQIDVSFEQAGTMSFDISSLTGERPAAGN